MTLDMLGALVRLLPTDLVMSGDLVNLGHKCGHRCDIVLEVMACLPGAVL